MLAMSFSTVLLAYLHVSTFACVLVSVIVFHVVILVIVYALCMQRNVRKHILLSYLLDCHQSAIGFR